MEEAELEQRGSPSLGGGEATKDDGARANAEVGKHHVTDREEVTAPNTGRTIDQVDEGGTTAGDGAGSERENIPAKEKTGKAKRKEKRLKNEPQSVSGTTDTVVFLINAHARLNKSADLNIRRDGYGTTVAVFTIEGCRTVPHLHRGESVCNSCARLC